ncbi:hypothetical protein HBB16_02300 [Pseudonocardia sp. MCCB 268]|nr:hypothetical protein [Pseudonocardia cytotoxica]
MLGDSIIRGSRRLGHASAEVREQFIDDQIRMIDAASASPPCASQA